MKFIKRNNNGHIQVYESIKGVILLENVSIDDLDKENFDVFRKEVLRSGKMNKANLSIRNAKLFESLESIEDGKLKKAIVLLFHRNPEKWITDSCIKIGNFRKGLDLQYQDEMKRSLI